MANPHITILLATLNGARFLPAQLQSLLAQTHTNWSLVASDDGSSDVTMAILHAFDRANPGRVLRLLEGPRLGSAAQNFMALLLHRDLATGMVALADQDDVWLPQKLARAVDHLAKTPADIPAIYAAESILTDKNLRPFARTAERKPAVGFRNALVQNLFAGHSTVLNAAALSLVRDAGTPRNIAFHDWWLYQLVAGAGGACLLDPAHTVLYRQHSSNAFGAAVGMFGAVKRLNQLCNGTYNAWLCAHWRALHDAAPHLTPDARDLIRDLLENPHHMPRTAQFRYHGLNRSTAPANTALWLAAHFGKA